MPEFVVAIVIGSQVYTRSKSFMCDVWLENGCAWLMPYVLREMHWGLFLGVDVYVR